MLFFLVLTFLCDFQSFCVVCLTVYMSLHEFHFRRHYIIISLIFSSVFLMFYLFFYWLVIFKPSNLLLNQFVWVLYLVFYSFRISLWYVVIRYNSLVSVFTFSFVVFDISLFVSPRTSVLWASGWVSVSRVLSSLPLAILSQSWHMCCRVQNLLFLPYEMNSCYFIHVVLRFCYVLHS